MASFTRTLLAVATLGCVAFLDIGPVAASSGLAYGSVTKFSMGDDGGAAPAPGTYRADYEAASSPAAAADAPHVPFGFGKMLAKAQSAMAMLKNGTAENHTVATTKERVDNVAAQTADITDCTARTLTHLDLAKRTYSVTSLDRPETAMPAGPGRRGEPGPAPTDDGTKFAVDVSTRALGALAIEGVATNGYETKIKMTATKPSGESSSTTMLMTAYYSAMEEPHFACVDRPAIPATAGGGAGAASMANYLIVMKALRTPKGDSRFSVTSSGPPLPASKLAMWQSMTMSGGQGRDRGSFAILTERGDLRAPVSDNDPAFGIPAGFVKVDASG